MNLFSELYVKHLARTLFFISIGVSSSIGQHLLSKNILHDDFVSTVIAVMWAALLIVIYSWFVAEREHKFKEMEDSFNYHRTLKPNNPIGAINKDYADPESFKKNDITKVEFVHTLEPMKPEGTKS